MVISSKHMDLISLSSVHYLLDQVYKCSGEIPLASTPTQVNTSKCSFLGSKTVGQNGIRLASLREETAEGLEEVIRHKYDVNTHRVYLGGVKGGRIVKPSKTALLLIEYQNEFASERGKLHEGVKEVMESTNTLQNTVDLVENARSVGVSILHLPILNCVG
jgi:hypothetical protein